MDPIIDDEASTDSPMTELVTQRLREEILDGTLQPGERIVQESLARRYGTSRLPVREALRHLTIEGFVVHQRDVGARVAPINHHELIEVYRVRELLEPEMVREGVPRLSAEDLAAMGELLLKSEQHQHNLAEYLKYDRQFHFTILRAAGMPRFLKIAEGLWDTTRLYRRIFAGLPHKVEISVIEHRLFLDAIERRAAEDAAQICAVHTRRARLGLAERATPMADGAGRQGTGDTHT